MAHKLLNYSLGTLAVVRASKSFLGFIIRPHMLTGAIASIGCQRKSRFADALEASVFVYAHAVEAHVGGGTFIMVWRRTKPEL